MCHILGEFAEVSARVTTRIEMWKHEVTGDDFPVDAPHTVSVVGVLRSGAEVSWQVASVPHHASGTRMEVYGSKGTLVLTSKSVNIGPSHLELGIGKGEMQKIVVPASYRLAPADMPQSPAVNVAQAYARYAAAMETGAMPAPDFGHAVVRHALIDALERSHAEGRVIKLG